MFLLWSPGFFFFFFGSKADTHTPANVANAETAAEEETESLQLRKRPEEVKEAAQKQKMNKNLQILHCKTNPDSILHNHY